jgi:hypothetical protein
VACAPSQLAKVAKSVLDKSVDDLVQMDDINEAMIVHNLRKRFKNDHIYVRCPPPQSSALSTRYAHPFHRLPGWHAFEFLNLFFRFEL